LAAAALASAIAALGLRSTPALAYITVGDWENGNTEGWFDWETSSSGYGNGDYNPGAEPSQYLPSSIYSFSTEGATLGTHSLAMDQPSGFWQPLALKSEFETDSEGNSEKTDMVFNSEFAVNLTYNSAEWTGSGINTHLNLTINFGYVDSTGNHSFGGSINAGAFDTGNPSNVGSWDPVNYSGVTTRTITYSYSQYQAQMQSIYNTYTAPGDATYFELYYSTYEVGQGPIYFDNARFTSPQITATWSNQAGLNGDGTWHWGSMANWTGGMPSNPGDIVNFATAIPGPETINLDENEEFQINVGTMNFSTGASYTIAQGTGGSLTLNGNIDNPDGSVTAGTSQINDEFGNHFITAPVILATTTTMAVGGGGNTLSISGNISGAGGLTVGPTSNAYSNGTVALSGANTYGGGTTVTSGTLLIDPTSTPKTTSALAAGSVSVSGGLLRLAPGVTGGSGPAVSSSVNLTSLSITGNGVLDVGNNHLIITYGASDPITTIAGYIKTGYNGGGWNGTGGIISSAALTNASGLLYGVGYADGKDNVVVGLSSGQIEVAYTLLGDANLDGLVNGSDFNILAANFNQSITGWDQGDFNYDGLVNASDFNVLAANFNQGVSGAASAGDVAALDAFAVANGLSLPTSSVPEPASASLLLLSGLSMLAHRRRRA
jgi:autotransporter-associated beta strand protein